MKNFFTGFVKKAEDVAQTQMSAAANSIRSAFGTPKPAAPAPAPSTPTPSLAQSITSGVGKLMGSY